MLRAHNLHIQRGRKAVLSDVTCNLSRAKCSECLGRTAPAKAHCLAHCAVSWRRVKARSCSTGDALGRWTGTQRAQRLAVLPQVSTLDFAFRVEEVVGMGRLPYQTGQVRDDEIIAAALTAADAGHLSGRSYLALSGGERQRVHLARVLAQLWPGQVGQTLLLDEPTSMLDPLHQHTTLQAVREFADRGAAVLVILHDLNLAARYCDRILLLEGGRPVALDTPEQVLRPDSLKAVFGLEVLVQPHPERGHPLIIAR
jgi:iron complex transport system ATP-binding protein